MWYLFYCCLELPYLWSPHCREAAPVDCVTQKPDGGHRDLDDMMLTAAWLLLPSAGRTSNKTDCWGSAVSYSTYAAGGLFGHYKMMQKSWRMTETLAHWYSSESTQQELSNEYQHDSIEKIFKNLCVLVLWMKVASALERLTISYMHMNYNSPQRLMYRTIHCPPLQKMFLV